MTNHSAAHLRQIVERAERIIEERRAVAADMRDLMAFAKGLGFDTKAIRALIKLRELEPDVRSERDAVIAVYRDALGIPDDCRVLALPDLTDAPSAKRKLTAKEKQVRDVLALTAAARSGAMH